MLVISFFYRYFVHVKKSCVRFKKQRMISLVVCDLYIFRFIYFNFILFFRLVRCAVYSPFVGGISVPLPVLHITMMRSKYVYCCVHILRYTYEMFFYSLLLLLLFLFHSFHIILSFLLLLVGHFYIQ